MYFNKVSIKPGQTNEDNSEKIKAFRDMHSFHYPEAPGTLDKPIFHQSEMSLLQYQLIIDQRKQKQFIRNQKIIQNKYNYKKSNISRNDIIKSIYNDSLEKKLNQTDNYMTDYNQIENSNLWRQNNSQLQKNVQLEPISKKFIMQSKLDRNFQSQMNSYRQENMKNNEKINRLNFLQINNQSKDFNITSLEEQNQKDLNDLLMRQTVYNNTNEGQQFGFDLTQYFNSQKSQQGYNKTIKRFQDLIKNSHCSPIRETKRIFFQTRNQWDFNKIMFQSNAKESPNNYKHENQQIGNKTRYGSMAISQFKNNGFQQDLITSNLNNHNLKKIEEISSNQNDKISHHQKPSITSIKNSLNSNQISELSIMGKQKEVKENAYSQKSVQIIYRDENNAQSSQTASNQFQRKQKNINQLNLANLENLQGNTMDTKSFKLSSRRNPKDVNLIYNPQQFLDETTKSHISEFTYLTYSSLRNSKADSKQIIKSVKHSENKEKVSQQGSQKSKKITKKTVQFKNQSPSEIINDFFEDSEEENTQQQNLSEIKSEAENEIEDVEFLSNQEHLELIDQNIEVADLKHF